MQSQAAKMEQVSSENETCLAQSNGYLTVRKSGPFGYFRKPTGSVAVLMCNESYVNKSETFEA